MRSYVDVTPYPEIGMAYDPKTIFAIRVPIGGSTSTEKQPSFKILLIHSSLESYFSSIWIREVLAHGCPRV
jgi:hypothetical protein